MQPSDSYKPPRHQQAQLRTIIGPVDGREDVDLLECGHFFYLRRAVVKAELVKPRQRNCYKCARGAPAENGERMRRKFIQQQKQSKKNLQRQFDSNDGSDDKDVDYRRKKKSKRHRNR